MVIELTTWTHETYKMHFTGFHIEDEYKNFKLHTGLNTNTEPNNQYSTGMAKAFTDCNMMQFTTKDRDNDQWRIGNCADKRGGGWWFHHCSSANLNGKWYMYGSDDPASLIDGIFWQASGLNSARGTTNKITLKEVTMRVQVP